ncbi:MAG: hypothetical protein ACR2OE_04630 [Thermomicrobiales bacterium]
MAKNGRKGGGRRGAIRGRTQFLLPNGHYAKRDRQTGEILAIKADLKPFKGVVMEKQPVQQHDNHNSLPESRQAYIAG